MREDIAFLSDDQSVTLRGWLYRPEDAQGPRPLIVMAHGFSAVKEHHLAGFAQAFCDAGLVVLVYDNRNLGASDAPQPGEIDPWAQVDDYRAAITWGSQIEGVDAEKIGIWGSSYSGGHVLAVAGMDRRVKCVVSQVPVVSGSANARHLMGDDDIAALQAVFNSDRLARYNGGPPARIQVTWADESSEPCVLPTPDAHDFFFGPIRDEAGTWRNDVTMRSVEMLLNWEPNVYAPLISPTPLLMVVADDDQEAPPELAYKVFDTVKEPKKLLTLRTRHFSAYTGEPFAESSVVQRDWFLQYLT